LQPSTSLDLASFAFLDFLLIKPLSPMTTSTRLMASFVEAEPLAGAEAILIRKKERRRRREGKGREGNRSNGALFFFFSLSEVQIDSKRNFQISPRLSAKKRIRLCILFCTLSLFP